MQRTLDKQNVKLLLGYSHRLVTPNRVKLREKSKRTISACDIFLIIYRVYREYVPIKIPTCSKYSSKKVMFTDIPPCVPIISHQNSHHAPLCFHGKITLCSMMFHYFPSFHMRLSSFSIGKVCTSTHGRPPPTCSAAGCWPP